MTITFKSQVATGPEMEKWENIDVDTLPPSLRKLYDEYKAKYAIATTARKAFAEAFTNGVDCPAGTEVRLGYKFGKLSFAYFLKSAPKSKAGLVSFASLVRR